MKKLLKLFLFLTLLTGSFLLVGCSSAGAEFRSISIWEAYDLIMENPDVIVLDVRSEEEFLSGHIEGSILLPVDQIEAQAEHILSDKDAVILVICRSGVRSQSASQALADLGFTNIYDIGGILSWPGEIVQ